jgi:hypothetical protein
MKKLILSLIFILTLGFTSNAQRHGYYTRGYRVDYGRSYSYRGWYRPVYFYPAYNYPMAMITVPVRPVVRVWIEGYWLFDQYGNKVQWVNGYWRYN